MSSRLLLALKSWPRRGKGSLPKNVGGEIIISHVCLPERLGGAVQMGGARKKAGAWEVGASREELKDRAFHFGLGDCTQELLMGQSQNIRARESLKLR